MMMSICTMFSVLNDGEYVINLPISIGSSTVRMCVCVCVCVCGGGGQWGSDVEGTRDT